MSGLEGTVAPGWDAVEGALRAVYRGEPPEAHYGTLVKFSVGGPDPIDGVSVYRAGGHLHYVSFGFTELYVKETEDPEVSGYGFELSFRLVHAGSDVPTWPIQVMQNLARYVFRTGNVFAPGHHLDANGPLQEGADTAMRAVVFTEDRGLPDPVVSPFGRFRFLQMVGVSLGELEAARTWSSAGVIALLEADNPLLLTDLARASRAEDPDFVAAVTAGVAREGTSQGAILDPALVLTPTPGGATLAVTTRSVAELARLLRGRIPFGRGFVLLGNGPAVRFEPGLAVEIAGEAHGMTVTLPADVARVAAAGLKPVRGSQALVGVPGLRLDVAPFVIRDRDGTVVAEEG